MTPRLPPLSADDWDERVHAALAVIVAPERNNPVDAGNLLGTLARHPDLTAAFLTFNGHLLRRSTLTERLREIAILRAAVCRHSPYLWSHHVPIARRAGMSDAEIEAIRTGELTDDAERLVVRAVDELDADDRIGEHTWHALGRHLDERQVMDLIFTIGCYGLLAQAVNTFGIEEEHR
ncbi:carboxymuconolactone decarboxylase family protein [Mycobacterium sp. MYCO198283]|uniref:carboxymuconolactone decarboxylase family protein n=1 Tax=Mycobacterium sp. MYCO198283 TaxID=2883505 RepID=UPI001E55EC1E|nr:carboxymuconolactone decarboxylase family protein [Mycobacterium sp. MYCO198283]MCG5434233.1 carboxymuconolactone decarboxylase family protein [Mycobacterium sp. MYCO198283]